MTGKYVERRGFRRNESRAETERGKRTEVEEEERRGTLGLEAKSSVEKGIRGGEGGGGEQGGKGIAEGVYTHQQAMAVSGWASLPAPGAPGLWSHNEVLFEFTVKQCLEKQCPTSYFY